MKDRRHEHSDERPLDLTYSRASPSIWPATRSIACTNRCWRSFRLTYPQHIAMVLLWERDGQTVGELGQQLFLETNTLTLAQGLETLGYAQAEPRSLG